MKAELRQLRTSQSLARREGWFAFAERPDPIQPDRLALSTLRQLSAEEAAYYAFKRQDYLSRVVIKTPQLERVHDALDVMLGSDLQDFDRVHGAPVIDAMPGVGKSTAVNQYGRQFHREAMKLVGNASDTGVDVIPVARVSLSGNTTPKSLALQILEFYGHPNRTGNAMQLTSCALDCVLECQTQLIIIDDIHFLNLERRDGVEVSNTLKSLANDFPATFIFVGVGVEERGLFREGLTTPEWATAQLGRRWTRLDMPAFQINTETGRKEWRTVLLGLEKALVLCDSYPGMLADDLSDYFFARTSGYIGSMMQLILAGTAAAMREGRERLSKDLLDRIKLAQAAQQAYPAIDASMRDGKLTSLPNDRKVIGKKPDAS